MQRQCQRAQSELALLLPSAACLLQKYKKKSNLTNCLLYLLYLCTRKQQGCLFRLTSHASLDSLCDDMNVDKKAIVCKLAAAGFEYDSAANRFW